MHTWLKYAKNAAIAYLQKSVMPSWLGDRKGIRPVVFVILRLAVLVELRLATDTDRHTQTQTQAHG